jgi:esterase/lipase superfamily enzyme
LKAVERWRSERLETDFTLVRWGSVGVPVLIFPTAGGDHEEIERFGMVSALSDLLAAGRVKVYSVDSINGRALLTGADTRRASWLLSAFDAAIRWEVVPAIRADTQAPGAEVIVAGSSIGAFNALEVICRHPDVFSSAICLSGTYDLSRWIPGPMHADFYFSSPLHYLPHLDDGDQLSRLRERFVLIAHGLGRYEEPSESWRVASVLGEKGIPNRVDEWGQEWAHDWATWRAMLPKYLEELAP